jgi:allophanate hydrolase subunit 1
MDEHILKKNRYMSSILTISKGVPGTIVLLVEIVNAYHMDQLDELFAKIHHKNLTGSDLYVVYKETCGKDNAEFVRHIMGITQ